MANEKTSHSVGNVDAAAVRIGDIRAGHDVIIELSQPLLASNYAGKLEAFCEEYLSSETALGAVPFGGRGPEMAMLDSWLHDEIAETRYLITAPAGRGKSALLVQWVLSQKMLLQSGGTHWQFVFVPVSIRYETHQPETYYEMLAAQLAAIAGVKLNVPQTDKSTYFADQSRSLLKSIVDQHIKILIVIDGIDEALDERFSAEWFPRNAGSGVRVLLSARQQVGDIDSNGWVQRLRWDQGVRVKTQELQPLDLSAIGDLLTSLGAPLDTLAKRPQVVAKLHDLTDGEPLLLRLYAEDLWGRGEGIRRLSTADLEIISPGFGGYFRHWLSEQERSWTDAGTAVDFDQLEKYFAIFAAANGRLQSADLRDLIWTLTNKRPDGRMERHLRPLRRFLIGVDHKSSGVGVGYILSHPKFGAFLREEYLDPDAVAAANDAFVRWGRSIIAELRAGSRAASDTPRYLLQYHTEHLRRIGAPLDAFQELIEKGWLSAFEKIEGGYRGFARDIRLARELFEEREVSGSPNEAMLIRCDLMLSSIASIGSRIPVGFLARGLEQSILTFSQVQHWLEFKPDNERILALAMLARHLPDEVLAETIVTARASKRTVDRVQLLTLLAPAIADNADRRSLLNELLASCALLSASGCAILIKAVASILFPEQLAIALSIARSLDDNFWAIRAILALEKFLPIDAMQDEVCKAVPRVPEISDSDHRAEAIVLLSKCVPKGTLKTLVEYACCLPNAYQRIRALSELILRVDGNLTGQLRERVNSDAKLTTGAYSVAYSRIELFRCASDQTKEKALEQAISGVSAYRNAYSYIDMVGRLSSELSPAARDKLIDEIAGLDTECIQAGALAAIAHTLTSEQVARAVRLSIDIEDRGERASALTALVPYAAANDLPSVLRALMAVGDEEHQAYALIAIALKFDDEDRNRFLAAAMNSVRAICNSRSRASALAYLLDHLEPGQIDVALQLTQTIGQRGARLLSLAAFRSHLTRARIVDASIIADVSEGTALAAKYKSWDEPRTWLKPVEDEDDKRSELAPHEFENLALEFSSHLRERNEKRKEEARLERRLRRLISQSPNLDTRKIDELIALSQRNRSSLRISALLAIAKCRLSKAQMRRAFVLILALDNAIMRDRLFKALLPQASTDMVATLRERLGPKAEAVNDRSIIMRNIPSLIDVIEPEHVPLIGKSVLDAVTWFP